MTIQSNGYNEILANDDLTMGQVKTNYNPLQEIGDTGLKRAAGILDEEFLPALRGRKAVKVFREMSLNDPTVASLLFAIEQLLRQVEWTVVNQDNSPEGEEASQFVEECMNDMSHTWDDMVAEALSFITYGWSWHEIVYKKRVGPWEKDPKRRSKYTDGRYGWRKIPIRSQETLLRWVFDEDGGVKAMVQMPPPSYAQRVVPIERSLLFRARQSKGSPEGISLLRGAYRPWFFKKRLEEFEAIGVERDLAGMPVARVPSDYMKAKQGTDKHNTYKAFKKMVQNVRRDEHEGLVIPREFDPETKQDLFDFELMSSGGGRSFDTNALITRYEQRILMTVLADFIMLGNNQTGSYAMHVDKTGIFRAALNSLANVIADTFNRHAIPKLFAQNGWKLETLPEIKPSNVDPPNLAELGGFMQTMSGLGMQFFPDPDLEKYLRSTAHLPELPEEELEMRRQMASETRMQEMMETAMMGTGMQQKAQMVAQGMTPEQAEMAAQQATPEMAEAEQTGQMVGQARAQMNPEVMAAQQAQQQMELQGEAQRTQMQNELSTDPEAREHEMAMRQMEMQAKQQDFQNKTETSRMQMDSLRQKSRLDMASRAAAARGGESPTTQGNPQRPAPTSANSREELLARLRELTPEALRDKSEPAGQNNVSTYTRGGRGER